MKKKTGVVIGRFQPFHYGHAWLINKALTEFEDVVILIGSTNVEDENNPWSYKSRKKMLEEFIRRNKIEKKVLKLDKIEDVPDDNKWLEVALQKIKTENFTVIGDNEWVNGIFESKGYKILRIGFFQRELYEGLKIRKLYNANENWQERIPKYIVKLLE